MPARSSPTAMLDPVASRQLLDRAAGVAARGETGPALALLSAGLNRIPTHDAAHERAMHGFAALVVGIVPDLYHPQLDADLCVCLGHPSIDPQPLARIAAALLLLKRVDPGEIGDDPLWIAFLTRCINVDPAMERLLCTLRADALQAIVEEMLPAARIAGVAALAVQAFAGDYVLPVGEREQRMLAMLAPDAPADRLAALGFALYRPLAEWPSQPAPGPQMPASAAAVFDLLVARTRDDLIAEAGLARALPRLRPSGVRAQPVSRAVKAQYEAHPYPRWLAPPAVAPQALRGVIEALPGVARDRLRPGPPAVLVAGCGTGYEAIDLARRDPTLTITAIDLSTASLAHGQRMAQRLGVTTIRFVAGDLLDLDALETRFDVVVSTGVLHHMEAPSDGLAAIRRSLAPGGVVRLGLYSRRARSAVHLAHALIAAEGWSADAAGVAAFRAHMLALAPGDPLAVLRDSDDFYNLVGCIDLVFHAHEQAFSLPQVDALMREGGVPPIGIDAPPAAVAAFAGTYGSGSSLLDMAAWDALERRASAMFAGMYQVWGQVADG